MYMICSKMQAAQIVAAAIFKDNGRAKSEPNDGL